ncbi:MAG: hypothetical protein KDA88_23595, partial [Planctomycetaceae bacterium]|nr:hypothetical protein [Planctomycetaceae bacterium]
MADTRVVLIEDDPNQAQWIAEDIIWKVVPAAGILFYDSEYSFLQEVDDGTVKAWDPTHAVIDLLVRYFSPHDLAAMNRAGQPTPEFEKAPKPNHA